MFTKETFDEDIVDAFKFLPINEFKKDDDEKEVDFKALTGTAMRTAPYVNKWINNPENAFQNYDLATCMNKFNKL